MATSEKHPKELSHETITEICTTKEEHKIENFEELKVSTLDKSPEELAGIEGTKSLEVSELVKLCRFEDEDLGKVDLESRVERLRKLRDWFWKEFGKNAAEVSGFIYSISVESRLLSFLIARNFDLSATQLMIENHISWLSQYKIYEIDVKAVCPTAWKSKCWRIAGKDKHGIPIIWIQAAIWNPKDYYSVDEYIYYISYMIENARRISMNNKQGDKINMLFDMKGFSMFTCDMECIKKLIVVLMDHFPETLKTAFVVNTNVAFKVLMKLISYLLPRRTTRKMQILGSGGDMLKTLMKSIDRDVLRKMYGKDLAIRYPAGPESYVELI